MKANAMIKRLLMKKAPHTLRTSGCIKILAFKGMNQRVCRRFNLRRSPKGKSLPQNRKSKTVSSPASGLSLSISLLGLNAVALSKTFSAIRKRNTTISSWRLPVPSTTLELIAGSLKNLFAIMSIAQVLEAQFPETAESQPELLAHHYTEAGLTEHAVLYWYTAGQRAVERSAYAEAIAHLTKGLELLPSLRETPERTHREVDLLLALGAALR